MAEHIQVLLHTKDPSNRMYILALALTTHTFFKIKVSSPEEIIERSIKHAKSEKKFRQNSECFKDFPSLWKISPQEVKDVYEQVLASYRKLKPISQNFFEFHPQNNANESQENTADLATRINC
ncbi:unnamed protein product [Rhizophagus irregularis]|nr:unnamed protein product [Rhizophagus irregularis]